MSRIGKTPVMIPNGVKVSFENDIVFVVGEKGELNQKIDNRIKIAIDNESVKFYPTNKSKETRALHGLYRSLVNNMVIGVTKGHEKTLEIYGIGYKIDIIGNYLLLNLGFSHPIYFEIPKGTKFEINNKSASVDKPAVFKISSIDKQLVGEVAAKIRAYRKPDPYKGKGIRYQGEYIIKKAGKTAAK